MDKKEGIIRNLILEYLLDEDILKKKVSDDKIEFGFEFAFPPGRNPHGQLIGQTMFVFQPKARKFIIITIGTQLSPPHIKALKDSTPKFFMALRKLFLMKDVFFRMDVNAHKYKISDQTYFNEDSLISKNDFFKSVRKVFNTAAYGNIILNEFCQGKVKAEDIAQSKDFSPDNDFSIYT